MDSKIEYFITESNKRFDKIDGKLDQLISFRLMLMGGAFTISIICTVIMNIIMVWVKA